MQAFADWRRALKLRASPAIAVILALESIG